MYYVGVWCFSNDIVGKKCALYLRVHSSCLRDLLDVMS